MFWAVTDIYKFLNINLPRDASQQVKEGREVAFLEEAQIGDLAFFDNTKGKIIHVGIILSEQQIVHSSGYVRLSKLDRTGIWDEKQQTYTHRLRIIKRYLPDFSKEYLSDLKDTKEFFDTERENKNQLKFF